MFSMRPAYPPSIYALGAVTGAFLVLLSFVQPEATDPAAAVIAELSSPHVVAMEFSLD